MRSKTKRQIKSLIKALKLNKILGLCCKLYQDTALRDASDSPCFGHFVDSRGNRIPLIKGLRDHIKPGWQAMLHPSDGKPSLPSRDVINSRYWYWQEKMREVEKILQIFSFSFRGADVLEIGSYDGATAYALADMGVNHVLGTDMAAYYIYQTPDAVYSSKAVKAQNEILNETRNAYRRALKGKYENIVSFIEDDICSSNLSSDSVDIIISWEVLEHLITPAQAFREMYRLLKPGGIAFHVYNPFLSLNGGHSLCTLDFLWGHARLTDSDFEKYLREIRPAEREVSLSFYHRNLNRMTLKDLQNILSDVAFTPLAIVPWPERSHLDQITRNILKECLDIYPNAELFDLISPCVCLLLQKEKMNKNIVNS